MVKYKNWYLAGEPGMKDERKKLKLIILQCIDVYKRQGVYCTDLADAMLEEITERKGAVFAFLRKNGYECYESQAAAWYFSNINDSETYKEIAGNHFIEKYV